MAVSGDVIATAWVEIQAKTDRLNASVANGLKPALAGAEKAAAASGGRAGDNLAHGVTGGARKAAQGLYDALGHSQAFAPLFDQISEFVDKMDNAGAHTGKMAKTLLGVGAAATGVGGLLLAAASKDDAAFGQLQATVEAVGGNWDDYRGKVEKAASSETKYGYTTAQTADALDTLTQATHDPEAALNRLQLVTDLAARKHIDLNSAALLVARAMGGNARVFKQFGIEVKTGADGTKDINGALNQLATQLSGQAAASANTFTGRLEAMKARAEDFAATLGHSVGGALTLIGPPLLGVGAIIESGVLSKLKDIPANAKKAFSGMASALTSTTGLAVAGLAAIGIGFAFAAEQDAKANAALQAYAKSIAEDLDPSKFSTMNALQAQYTSEMQALTGAYNDQHAAAVAAITAQNTATHAQGDIFSRSRKDVDASTASAGNLTTKWYEFTPAAQSAGRSMQALSDRSSALSDQNLLIVTNVSRLQQQYGLTDRAVLKLASTYGINLAGATDDVTSRFAAMRTESETAKAPTDAMTLAAEQLASGFGDASARGGDLQTILDGLVTRKIDVREALLAEAKAAGDLSISFQQNGKDLTFTTKAGQANNAALDTMAQTTLRLTTATFTATGSVKAASDAFNTGVTALDKAASAAGFNAAQIAAMNVSLGLTPDALQAIVDKAGAATTAAQNVTVALRGIPQRIPVDIIVQRIDTGGSIGIGGLKGNATGGLISPGMGNAPAPSDTELRLLTPGEYVVRRDGSNLGDALAHFGAGGGGSTLAALVALSSETNRLLRTLLPQVGPSVAKALPGGMTGWANARNQPNPL